MYVTVLPHLVAYGPHILAPLENRYGFKSGKWTEVAGMLIPRSGSAACLLGGYIYVIGMNHFVVKNFMKSP